MKISFTLNKAGLQDNKKKALVYQIENNVQFA